MRDIGKSVAHLEKVATLKKVFHSRKKKRHTWKTHLLRKIYHTCKKCPTFWKMGHTRLESAKLGKVRHTWKNARHLEYFVTLVKLRHILKNGSVLICGTPGKMQPHQTYCNVHCKLILFTAVKRHQHRKSSCPRLQVYREWCLLDANHTWFRRWIMSTEGDWWQEMVRKGGRPWHVLERN